MVKVLATNVFSMCKHVKWEPHFAAGACEQGRRSIENESCSALPWACGEEGHQLALLPSLCGAPTTGLTVSLAELASQSDSKILVFVFVSCTGQGGERGLFPL